MEIVDEDLIKVVHMVFESTSSSIVGTFAFFQCLHHKAKAYMWPPELFSVCKCLILDPVIWHTYIRLGRMRVEDAGQNNCEEKYLLAAVARASCCYLPSSP